MTYEYRLDRDKDEDMEFREFQREKFKKRLIEEYGPPSSYVGKEILDIAAGLEEIIEHHKRKQKRIF